MRESDASGWVGEKRVKDLCMLRCNNVGGCHCLIKSSQASAQQSLKQRRSIEQSPELQTSLASAVASVSVHVRGHPRVDLPCFAGVALPSEIYVSVSRSRDTIISLID
jgi:hypothetical protein